MNRDSVVPMIHRREQSLEVCLFALLALLPVGCATPGGGVQSVTRIAPEQVVDLSGQWNDTDSRLVAEALVQDCLESPWLSNWAVTHPGRLPIVVVGKVRNRTRTHAATADPFISALEAALIRSGRVGFVADPAQRAELLEEIEWQQTGADPATRKRSGRAVAADFYLHGSIRELPDMNGNTEIVFYQVDLELLELESQRKVWVGSQKVKKLVKYRSLRP